MGSGRWYTGFHKSLWYGLCWIFIVSCAAVTIDGQGISQQVQHDATSIDYNRIVLKPVVRPFMSSAEDKVARSRTEYPPLSTKRAPNELTGPDDSSTISADGMEYHMSQSINTGGVKVHPSTTGLAKVTSESGPLTGTPLEISELPKISSIAVVLPSVTTQRSGIITPGSTERNTAQPGIGERTTAVPEETVTFQPGTIKQIIVSAEETMVPEDTTVKIMGQLRTITQLIVSTEETMLPQDTTVKSTDQPDTTAQIIVSKEETMIPQDTTVKTIGQPDTSAQIIVSSEETMLPQDTAVKTTGQPDTTAQIIVSAKETMLPQDTTGKITDQPDTTAQIIVSAVETMLPQDTTVKTVGQTDTTAQIIVSTEETMLPQDTTVKTTDQPHTTVQIIVSAEETMLTQDTTVKTTGQTDTTAQIIVSTEETMLTQDTIVKTTDQLYTTANIIVSAEETMLPQDPTAQTIGGPDTTEPTMFPSGASDTPQVQVNTTDVTLITSDNTNQFEIPASGSKPTTVPSSTADPVTEGKKKTPKTAMDTTTVSPSSADANMMQSTIAKITGVPVEKPSSSVASLLPRTPTEGTSMHTSVAPEDANEPVTGIPSSSESLNLTSTTASSISSSSTKLSTNTPCTNNNCSHMDTTSSADQLTASNDVSDVTDSEHLLNKTDSGPRIDNSAIFIVGLGVAGLLVFCSLVIIIILIYILRKRSAKTYHMNKHIDAAYSNNKRTIRFDNDYFSAVGDPGKDNHLLPVEWSNNRSSNDNISKLSPMGENTYEVIPAEGVNGSDDDVYLSTFRAKKKIPLKPAVPLLNHEYEINDITVCSP